MSRLEGAQCCRHHRIRRHRCRHGSQPWHDLRPHRLLPLLLLLPPFVAVLILLPRLLHLPLPTLLHLLLLLLLLPPHLRLVSLLPP